jgi:hypothetical protein
MGRWNQQLVAVVMSPSLPGVAVVQEIGPWHQMPKLRPTDFSAAPDSVTVTPSGFSE